MTQPGASSPISRMSASSESFFSLIQGVLRGTETRPVKTER